MSLSQLEEWFDAFRQFGYIPGFIMLYLRAIVPVLPLTLYVVLLIHAYGLFPGIIISWLGIVSGTFTVFLICKKFVNTIRMKKLKSRKSVQRINIIASLSHIKIKYYFFVLVISKLISITILGVMGKEIFTIFTNPLRALIMIVLLVVLWFISKKVEKYFMGSTKE